MTTKLDWVIIGGESGPQARPMQMQWLESVVRQCRDANVPVFVKQLGRVPVRLCSQCGRTIGHVMSGFVEACGPTHAALIAELMKVRDSKGGDPSEWPNDLRIREFPRVAVPA